MPSVILIIFNNLGFVILYHNTITSPTIACSDISSLGGLSVHFSGISSNELTITRSSWRCLIVRAMQRPELGRGIEDTSLSMADTTKDQTLNSRGVRRHEEASERATNAF